MAARLTMRYRSFTSRHEVEEPDTRPDLPSRLCRPRRPLLQELGRAKTLWDYSVYWRRIDRAANGGDPGLYRGRRQSTGDGRIGVFGATAKSVSRFRSTGFRCSRLYPGDGNESKERNDFRGRIGRCAENNS